MDRATDPRYLGYQYDTDERLRIRTETHQRYSERTDDFVPWMLDQLDLQSGDTLLDAGCGYGSYHPTAAARGARRIVALDRSEGMVRSARQQAARLGLPVMTTCADVTRLPFRDREFERVMCNHVLYHVPDQLGALRELRRVTRPGGQVILATNSAESYALLRDVHVRAARQLGYEPGRATDDRFSLEHLDLVRQVFPNAEVRRREDALVFPSVDAALRYYASGTVDMLAQRPADEHHRAELFPLVAEQIEAIVAREGHFRVPKVSGCFIASV